MAKKGKAIASKKSDMVPLFFDITRNKGRGTTTLETMYNLLEEEKPRPLVKNATSAAHESSDASYFEIECSFLHRTATRPKIIPYKDMVKWVIDEVDISNKTFKNKTKKIMWSFSLDNLQLMYQLPEPHNLYKKVFLEHFSNENEDLLDFTWTWRLMSTGIVGRMLQLLGLPNLLYQPGVRINLEVTVFYTQENVMGPLF